jgi:hypothetical protein
MHSEVTASANRAASLSDRLAAAYAQRADLSDDLARMPGELQEMLRTLPTNFAMVNKDLLSIYGDTTQVEVPRHVRYMRLTAIHMEQVHELKVALDSMTIAMDRMADQPSGEDVDQLPIARSVLAIGSAFDILKGKVVDELRSGRDEEDPLLSQALGGYDSFTKDGSTLTAHMYWSMYSRVYTLMGLITVGIGLLLMVISGPLNRMMHGVR